MSNQTPFLSLIVPIYNESGNIEWQYKLISKVMPSVVDRYELIYVDDGSTDNSLDILKRLRKADDKVRVISFSRNFGKEAATSAGLKVCAGDAALILDADGQHPVELANLFIKEWQNGHQVVVGIRRTNTNEGLIKHYGSILFYRILNSMTGGGTIPRSTDFRLLDRRVIDEYNKLTERNRITRGLIDWLGFRRTTIDFDSPERHSGKASYGFSKLVKLAMHAFISQTTKPLQIAGILGTITVLVSTVAGLFLLIEKYALGDPMNLAVTGTSILAIFVSFLVGIVLICQWLLALYVESIHGETQNRPLYIIDEEI